MGIDPTMKMSGPPPTGAGYNFCRSCSIELQNLLSWETDGLWCPYLISISFFDFFCALKYILDLIEGDQDSAALTPLLKYFTGFHPLFFNHT